jgi:hypothetical protein
MNASARRWRSIITSPSCAAAILEREGDQMRRALPQSGSAPTAGDDPSDRSAPSPRWCSPGAAPRTSRTCRCART